MLTKGTRVSLHPATDHWMRGDRYGKIVGFGHTRDYLDSFTKKINKVRPYLVKLDISGKTIRMHPENVFAV
ncbi:hypothetical protein LCGC14_2842320 [marine sediment metagenome]|uniref:Uncharacterized protein n=1 Tax=marine sediment metagenome TaxID=412755 RepID=A0A0F9AJA3_9ZZZZ